LNALATIGGKELSTAMPRPQLVALLRNLERAVAEGEACEGLFSDEPQPIDTLLRDGIRKATAMNRQCRDLTASLLRR
jgi:hypothetical protein